MNIQVIFFKDYEMFCWLFLFLGKNVPCLTNKYQSLGKQFNIYPYHILLIMSLNEYEMPNRNGTETDTLVADAARNYFPQFVHSV